MLKVRIMLDVNYEFRKGILFVRLLGVANPNNITKLNGVFNIINQAGIKAVVINLDNIKAIDAYFINYLLSYYDFYIEDDKKMFICSSNCFKNKFEHHIPIIRSEIDAFNVI